MPGRIWFLRSGLYRLPELVNVLRGDLAFFGPPPERPEFLPVLSRHIPCYPFLLAVKPGILGWSQVNVSQPMEGVVTRLEYDFYYIKRRTVALDTYIAIHSLLGEGTPAPAPQS
jgi:lipopolysaccharide/colanic/teichoic acid biosynthesis glycosyltransferase